MKQNQVVATFRRFGLTLVETLIALILVLAMGALIFPSLMDSLDERSFETAADITNEQLVLARAHAQATGTPVEVTYNANTSQVRARMFLPDHAVFDGLTEMSAKPGVSDATQSVQDKSVIAEGWATRLLGRGVRLAARPPADATNHVAVNDEDEFAETLDNLGQGQEVRLAVFMPDGSALMGDEFWLNDEKGRVGVFTINPWSGLPLFKRLADLTARAAEAAANQSAENE